MTASIVFRRQNGAKQTRSGLNNRARGSAPGCSGFGRQPDKQNGTERPEGRPWNGPAVLRRHCLPKLSTNIFKIERQFIFRLHMRCIII